KPVTSVQTCRGSHTHTVVTDPNDPANIYIYVSGSAPVRSPNELAGCSGLTPDKDPNSELFRIEVIQGPLPPPAQPRLVSHQAITYRSVSGSAPVRSPNELAGCSGLTPDKDPNSELFRIEVIQVPLAHPEQARVVSKPAILADLAARESHGEAPEDIAAAAKAAAEARAKGGFTATIRGTEIVVGPRFVAARLDSSIKARGGGGAPTGADS